MKRSILLGVAAVAAAVAVYLVVGPSSLLALGLAPLAFGAFFTSDDVVRYLIGLGVLDAAGGVKKNVKIKTADYTIVTGVDPSGTIFTNRGAAGAVIFTLPAPAAILAGVFYEFLVHAGQNVTVKTATADTLVAKNDAAADSVALSTAGELIGGHMVAVCDGTSWFVYGAAVGHTFTVAT